MRANLRNLQKLQQLRYFNQSTLGEISNYSRQSQNLGKSLDLSSKSVYSFVGRNLSSSRHLAQQEAQAKVQEPKGGSPLPWILVGGAILGGGGYYYYTTQQGGEEGEKKQPQKQKSQPGEYDKVKESIAESLEKEGYDDGSMGPILVRLAWHASGTWDKNTKTGGSEGATMRYEPESTHGSNAGLEVARNHLEPIKKEHPWISYADLWTLAGCVAIQEMGGPEVPWRPGRVDDQKGLKAVKEDRLPDGQEDGNKVRKLFYRMGFNDQEIVALSGAHALGRCHTDRSGYVNPWTNAPTTFSNMYFTELLNTKWTKKKWDGPLQYEDPSGELMMLPSDMALVWDRGFKKYVELYAKDDQKFFDDFAKAFSTLLELGVNFQPEGQAA